MSAVNIIPTAKGVSIFTDAAVYSPTGVLQSIEDKCFVTANGKLAIGGRGNHGFAKLIADLVSNREWDFDTMAADAGTLIDRVFAEAEDAMLERAGKARNDVFVVGWSIRQAGVRTAFWSSLFDPRFSVGNERAAWIAPELPPEKIERATATARAAGMDIGAFGLALIEMQRMDKGDPMLGTGDRHTVGGYVLRTDVAASGVSQRIVHRWPEDRIGAPIMPVPALDPIAHPNVTALAGVVAGATRAERRRLQKLHGKAVA